MALMNSSNGNSTSKANTSYSVHTNSSSSNSGTHRWLICAAIEAGLPPAFESSHTASAAPSTVHCSVKPSDAITRYCASSGIIVSEMWGLQITYTCGRWR